MRVMIGDTREVKDPETGQTVRWSKIEVELDETDLLRMLTEAGHEDPATSSGALSTAKAFTALENQATALVGLQYYHENKALLSAEDVTDLNTQIKGFLLKAKAALTVEPAKDSE